MQCQLYSLRRLLIINLFLFAGAASLLSQTINKTECCSNSYCKLQAQYFADSFSILTRNFGAAPSGQTETGMRLRILKIEMPGTYHDFKSLIKEYRSWEQHNYMAANCFASLVMWNDHTVNWVDETRSLYTEPAFRSSQFCRGFRFLAETGLGIADAGLSTESFYASIRGLISYTIAPHDASVNNDHQLTHCNGRVRLIAGLSQSYISKAGALQSIVRVETRIADLHTMLGSIGNFKLLLQAGYGLSRSINTIGGGLGFEIEYGGVHMLYERMSGRNKSGLQINFTYRL